MKILVTGGTGFIGSHTAVELIAAGHEVVLLDNLVNSKESVVGKIQEITGVRPEFIRADIRDRARLEEIFAAGGYELVMHFAGLKAVGESCEKPLEYYEVNVGGTVNLLEAMEKSGVKSLVFSSSATVYGAQKSSRYVETMQTGVMIPSPYGRTKFMIEEIVKDLCAADAEFRATLLRYFNPIGAHESGLIGEDPNGRPNNLMPIMLKVARGEYPELEIYGDDYATADGTCVRDYIHVVDLARGHVAAAEKMRPGATVLNLGSGRGVSVMEMVKTFEEVSGKPLPYRIVGRRAGDLDEFYADASRAERELGWKTEKTVAEAIRDGLKLAENFTHDTAENPAEAMTAAEKQG